MVTDALWGLVCWIASHLVGLLPGWTLPGWLTSLPDESTTLGSYFGDFNVWLPLDAVLTVLAFILAATALSLGIRVTRMVISHVTGGGGSVS